MARAILIGKDTIPNYICSSTDISGSTLLGASVQGYTVLATDTGDWYIVDGTNNLVAYTLPTSGGGGGSSVVTNAGTFAVQDNGAAITSLSSSVVTQGTTAPTKIEIIGGKTNDGTPQYREIPEGAGGRSVIVEGIAGGTVVPISGIVDTELPAASALNGTIVKSVSAPVVGAATMYSDGTNLVEVDSTHPLPTSLASSTSNIGKVITPTFSVSDSVTRPANTTAYSTTQSINCNVSVTAMSYSTLTVTLTAANAFVVGDKITVAGVNTGFTATNIDGNWTCKTGTNSTTVVFDVLVQPTGTTPQTITAGTIAKNLSATVATTNGDGIILSRISVSMQGVAMTGAIRCYVYTSQQTCLVDQATFTLLSTNDGSRRDYFDLYPVTEGSGSNVTFASARLWEVIKCDPSDTKLYFRLVTEGASTPISGGVITLRISGIQLGG